MSLITKAIANGWRVKKYDNSLVKIYKHKMNRLSDNTITGVDGAAEKFIGLQTNDEFVLLVNVASFVRSSGSSGGAPV